MTPSEGPCWAAWQHRSLCPPSVDPDSIAFQQGTHRVLDPQQTWAAIQPHFTTAGFPSLLAIDYELTLISQDYRYPVWVNETARLIAMGRDLAAGRPDLDLTRPRPDRLRALFARFWPADDFRIEASRRGYPSDEAFHAAAVPFAGVIASGAMPRIEVGRLGQRGCHDQVASA